MLKTDPIAKYKKVNIAPTDYAALNKLSEHFVKHFVPQKQVFAKQAFLLPNSKPVSETPPVKSEPVLKEIPRELPTISLVKDSFYKMRSHVNDFDKVIIVRTKVTGQNEGTWGLEHIRKAFEKDVKSFVNTLKEYFHMFDKGLAKEIIDKEVFTQMEIEIIISQDIMHNAMNSYAAIVDYQSMEKSYIKEYNKNLELKVELLKNNEMDEKVVYNKLSKKCLRLESHCISLEIEKQYSAERERHAINNLKKHIANHKGKATADYSETINCLRVIALGIYKLDFEQLSPKLRKNREAHVDYLKKDTKHDDILHNIVEQARVKQRLDSDLYYACKFTTRIQELLLYCMTRSSTKELLSPFENPEQNFCSKRRLFGTPSLVESNSPEFNQNFNIEEQSEEEKRETMTETMEQYISKTRENYGCSKHEDANEHIEKVLEIVDLFHIPKVIQDQIMLRAFPVSLTGAARSVGNSELLLLVLICYCWFRVDAAAKD
ncbi:hypothetical protein Tco_0516706 [Tanacetum coccineum]